MSVRDNLYEVLGVNPRADQEVIKAAFKAMMRKHHPDVPGGDEHLAKLLNEANDILSDPAKRAAYDRGLERVSGKVIGEYRVLEQIAEGGFGKTYKGEHVRLGLPVCIKHCSKISPLYEDILVNETKAMWDLRHHAIPAVRDLIKLDDGSLALVMSYIPGLTLAQVVERVGRLDAETVAWMAERCLNAFMYLHYHGTVHGDVKPQNIIVQETRQIVLVDYGLSIVKPRADAKAIGFTPVFAPPEEIAAKPLLPESDFYSLGMSMIFALSGDIEATRRKQVPADTPEALCAFIKRLIVRDVLSRPNWDEDLCDTIRDIRLKDFGRDHSGMKPVPGF